MNQLIMQCLSGWLSDCCVCWCNFHELFHTIPPALPGIGLPESRRGFAAFPAALSLLRSGSTAHTSWRTHTAYRFPGFVCWALAVFNHVLREHSTTTS